MVFPTRPDAGGRVGRPTKVLVNMFQFQGFPKCNMFLYDVTIVEEGWKPPALPAPHQKGVVLRNATKPEVNRRIMKHLVATYGKQALDDIQIAYDGKANVYTTRALPFGEEGAADFKLELSIEEGVPDSKLKRFDVNIKFVKEIDMNQIEGFYRTNTQGTSIPQECLTALEVTLSYHPNLRFTSVGRSFFTSQGARALGNGIEVWPGFFQSIRPIQGGLALNIDVASTAFVERRPILELASEVWGVRDLASYRIRDTDSKKLLKIIYLTKVETSHQGDHKRQMRVNGISKRSAAEMRFDVDGRSVTVAEYFQSQYSMRLRYPNLPCLECGQKKSLFPFEVCTIVPGQKYARKLDEVQTANMIKFSCQRPNDRLRRVNDGIQELKPNESPQMEELGLRVDSRMMQVDARMLDAPSVKYGRGHTIRPQNGAWNLKDVEFMLGATLSNWGVLVVGDERDLPRRKAEEFVSSFSRMAARMNMRVEHPEPPIVYARSREDLDDRMRELCDQILNQTGSPVRVLLCMIRGGQDVYAQIKFNTDVRLGIPSQCMLIKHAFKISPQYICNLLLKVNAKLGGRNSELGADLPFLKDKTIVFGADVSHPGPLARGNGGGTPSIVAVVASMNRWVTSFSSVVRLQPPKREEIVAMKDTVRILLERFKALAGLPSRIIFFRDGVSESQFMTVYNHEVRAIREACMAIQPDGSYNPPITFIIIQKRHHIRMFPTQGSPTDRSGNVAPGTVIDSVVTHPKDFDFFLMSHSGIQGTSRPAHYYVLHDENGFTSDSMQEFCYNMCYTYARCTRSVSIVPPTYYAHLLAYRARYHCAHDLWGSDTYSETSSRSGQRKEWDDRELQEGLAPIHGNLLTSKPMFFI